MSAGLDKFAAEYGLSEECRDWLAGMWRIIHGRRPKTAAQWRKFFREIEYAWNEAGASDQPGAIALLPTAYEIHAARDAALLTANLRKSTALRQLKQKMRSYADLEARLTSGHRLVELKSIEHFCVDNGLEVPLPVRYTALWIEHCHARGVAS